MKLIFLLGIFFIVSMQPIFMVSILIFITLMYSYNIYESVGTYWFSYILMMVMLSGVLVVFTYMVTLIPNEKFEVYNLLMLFSFMVVMMIKFDFYYEMDMSLITVNLWITYLGVLNLFLIGFLLGIMLLVIILSCMSDGSFRIS